MSVAKLHNYMSLGFMKFEAGLWVSGILEGFPTFQQTLQLLSSGLSFSLAIATFRVNTNSCRCHLQQLTLTLKMAKFKILNTFCSGFLKAKVIPYTLTFIPKPSKTLCSPVC
jgi:hypothetical protein